MQQFVTFEMAEDLLVTAWEYLMRSPDRERGFLLAGSRSGWPEIVRERWDYPDEEARPRMQLSTEQSNLRDRMFIEEDCLAMQIAPAQRALVAMVLTMKRHADQPDWSEVWVRMGGKRCGVTSDALRMRYARSVSRVAKALEGRDWVRRMLAARAA